MIGCPGQEAGGRRSQASCGRGLSQRQRHWGRWGWELEAGELPLDVEGAEGQEIRNWAWDPGSRRTVG